MTLPVPRSLQPEQEKKGPPEGSLAVQAVQFHKFELGRMEFEHTRRPGYWVLHIFMKSGPFSMNFGQKLHRVVYAGWPGAKEVKVEWIEEFRSYCVRVFQKDWPEGWGIEEVETMLKEGLA